MSYLTPKVKIKLNRYKLNKTIGACVGANNAVVMKINTFNLAEHKEKGITNIDNIRKAGDRMTRKNQ